ncbi:NADP-dependent 3-hydroxy acid dehydrogenase YdfG [Archangium gephyra]|uniref:Dehydrogenase with different specificities n=1 Tax=Archangium gephyra TaxID=48 RepID=A0AAC8Q693_9BACT|nr:oxidoreductase [Archangium gephyra]AKJ01311.1 Dehydrogenase with different specificities [Archangium gephyra]REG34135.1 NADP-dependent 3-hydroxy acid dehydrogenase YdfG [Archangium gephyra]
MSKVWFITGATRGLGAELARAALAAGHTVVATGRKPEALERALGTSERLLAVPLDVTAPGQPEAAVKAALARFGRIDVLVNNAGYGLVGALEETSADELSQQFATNVLGLAAVTRAVLPTMRAQRSGHIFNMSSAAGLAGFPGASAYCASKFAVEGLSESLSHEVAPLGIKVTLVEPGYFRTEFLTDGSAVFAQKVIADYDATAGEMRRGSRAMNGNQAGDPRKLAQALLTLSAATHPPLRFNAGTDSVALLEQLLTTRREELGRWRDLSLSLAYAS